MDIAYPFDEAAFYDTWWETLAPKFQPLAREGEMVLYPHRLFKGLLTLREVRLAGWNVAWSQDLTPERLQQFQALIQKHPWDCLRLTWCERRRTLQAFEALAALGFPVYQLPINPDYRVDLSGGWEAYFQRLSRASRKDIRRKLAQAEPLNPTLHHYDAPHKISAFFERFIPLHREYWTQKTGSSYFDDPREQRFIHAWAGRLSEQGALVLDRLMLEGEPANYSMNIVSGQTRYAFLTVNTGIHREAFPGIVGLQLRIQAAAQAGLRWFNQGPGEYPYKVQSSDVCDNRFELVVINPASWRGRLFERLKLSRLETGAVKS